MRPIALEMVHSLVFFCVSFIITYQILNAWHAVQVFSPKHDIIQEGLAFSL
jgi:hypothetical protein